MSGAGGDKPRPYGVPPRPAGGAVPGNDKPRPYTLRSDIRRPSSRRVAVIAVVANGGCLRKPAADLAHGPIPVAYGRWR